MQKFIENTFFCLLTIRKVLINDFAIKRLNQFLLNEFLDFSFSGLEQETEFSNNYILVV